ncbi:unnamed protein product [Vicia faba]|uniref:Reverse transcriptase zinc-binding domain-containing protein n=1 Tax=Vicia faba TaxID=3906 RepID=A0AAV0ZW58_VICFA|nr:unnamed protein product [Vicia faba]
MKVDKEGQWEEGIWSWKVQDLVIDVIDSNIWEEFLSILNQVVIMQHSEDEFSSVLEVDKLFSAHSYSKSFKVDSVAIVLPEVDRGALSAMWKMKIPSNLKLFRWIYILNRLPTREKLGKREIVVNANDKCCAFCFSEEETKPHLFKDCVITKRI